MIGSFKKTLLSKTNRGFSLIELLIVFVVLGLLLVFSVLVIPPILAKSRDAQRKFHLDITGKALEEYFQTNGCFPSELPACGEIFETGTLRLLDKTPCDPKDEGGYTYVTDGTSCSAWYELYSHLETGSDPSIARVGCDEGCGPECLYNYGVSSTNQPLDTCKPPPTLYACAPNKACVAYENPGLSECPVVFPDDPTCQSACDLKENRCHDESGKKIPD